MSTRWYTMCVMGRHITYPMPITPKQRELKSSSLYKAWWHYTYYILLLNRCVCMHVVFKNGNEYIQKSWHTKCTWCSMNLTQLLQQHNVTQTVCVKVLIPDTLLCNMNVVFLLLTSRLSRWRMKWLLLWWLSRFSKFGRLISLQTHGSVIQTGLPGVYFSSVPEATGSPQYCQKNSTSAWTLTLETGIHIPRFREKTVALVEC